MAKKTNNSKPAESKAPISQPPVEEKAAKPARKKGGKPKAPAKEGTPKAKSPRASIQAKPVTQPRPAGESIAAADIALRAYFIAERRQKLGLPGDSKGDWLEAERQLKAEAAAKAEKSE